MRRTILAVTVLVAVTSFAATAFGGVKRHYSRAYHDAQQRCHDKTAPGRNIRRDGLRRGKTPKAADYKRSTATLERMCRPVQVAAPKVAPTDGNTSQLGSGVQSSTANCESGGDPTAVSPDGKYHGKWQFDQQTWDAYAPAGYKGTDPAAAPEGVQDKAAANVPYDAWPNC